MKDKDIDKLRRKALDSGWRIRPQGRGNFHEQWFAPDGETIVTVGLAKASRKTLSRLIVRLKKAGLKL